MSVQSSLDPYGSNTTLSSCGSDVGSDQKQHSVIDTPNPKVIVHKPDEFTNGKVNTTEKCPKREELQIEKLPDPRIHGGLPLQHNFNINNQTSEEVSGLYIRLMLRRKGQHDTVLFYKTHKF
ncbi:hypothetical protein PV327_011054 [Microctonus hyperodae]|uniref:Uncharacterized protein n=1 Tax=Microctonus hyperodae TaxID=165561 RepID=A0AA39F069_MICHY|nr:hypothetical protein PV327_011054 [Microctonus hyperodae]